MKKNVFLLLLICFTKTWAQQPAKSSSVEIYHQIEKLNFLGTVLYLAAHPDDENTRLISYFSNEKNARTAYLSLTRGDGGQNLIGPELRELLGVIRTQELIEARRIDGGEQFFSRANDFGFSKNPTETLQIWNKDEVMADIIWVIRNFKPDVIINRFDHRTPGTTHGHHTSSALLSFEAFDKVNDVNFYPTQLQNTQIWQPKRLFFNTSSFFYGGKDKFDKMDKSGLTNLKTGIYYEEFGKSNQEIAALSRSRHQSQGFGSSGSRGFEDEWLELVKGDKMQDMNNVFEGIDTSWNRVKNGKEIGDLLQKVQTNFDFKNPSASIKDLVKAFDLIQKLDNTEHWKNIKSEEIKKIIANCAGLFLEAVAENQETTKNSTIKVKLEAINRSNSLIKWTGIKANTKTNFTNVDLDFNKSIKNDIEVFVDSKTNYTQPYYLAESGTVGMYRVDDQKNIGKPDVIRETKITFLMDIEGISIPFSRNVVYKYTDDVKGEVYQPLDIVPVATSSIQEKVYIFPSNKEKTIVIKVKSGKENVSGKVVLEVAKGWQISPLNYSFDLKRKGEEFLAKFTLIPSKEASEIDIKSVLTIDNELIDKNKIDINYPHIYKQMVLKPSVSKAIRLDIKTNNEKIAYIMGAGDEVPNSLSQMGYSVEIVKPELISAEKMKNFDVIIVGIRAYNVVSELAFKQNILFDAVKSGKTMIVQYNTLDDFVTKDFSPFSIKVSRDRVTEENAEVRFLNPNHPILNYPNKITSKDFEGWKQEQGLYYPSEWAKEFEPIISSNDTGETAKNGAILAAKLEKGQYIYTGISFFRELPEGVAGAFRLMANMISIGKK